ncbi:MAG: putative heme transporter [Acidimicrobiaceae bacterium]
MTGRSTARRRPSYLFLSIGAVSLCLVAPTLSEAYGDIGDVAQLDMRWLALAIACEVASFVCCWELLRIVLRRDDWSGVAASQLAGNAVSQVVPGGGPAGAAVQLRMLVQSGCDVPTAIAGLTASGVLSAAGLLALPLLALPALWSGATVDAGLQAGVWASLALLVVLVGAVVVATRDRVLVATTRLAQRVVDVVGKGKGPQGLVGHALVQRDLLRDTVRRQRGRALALTMGQALGGYLALYLVVVAAGLRPNVVVVVAAFAVANVAGMIPFTPAGLGFVEVGLASVLALGGIPYPTALVVAVAYRLVSSWLPAVIGGGAFLWFRDRRAMRACSRPNAEGLTGYGAVTRLRSASDIRI